jgi:hypothetical protein
MDKRVEDASCYLADQASVDHELGLMTSGSQPAAQLKSLLSTAFVIF